MTKTVLSRDQFEAWDAADPLATFRDRFVIPNGERSIYANGNSLGRPPRAAALRVAGALDEWARDLSAGWERWIDLPFDVGDRLGSACLGAAAGQVAIADSTSVNLHKAIVAALERAGPDRSTLVVAADEFPTDRYLMQSLASQRGLGLRTVSSGDEVASACDAHTSVAVLSLVNYRSGVWHDLAATTAAVHACGATLVWDLSHAVGAVPVNLDAAGVELAVGCSYKYLNGGPGAPAFVYVSHAAQRELRQPLWGWFGQRDLFAMGPSYDPADGIRSWMVGTPNIAGTVAVDAGVELIAQAGIEAVREKSVALTALAHELAVQWLVPLGATLASPHDPSQRAGHVAIAHARAQEICAALIDRQLVIPDFRRPDVIRLGFAPLYTRLVDVWDALDRTRTVMEQLR